MSVKMGYIPNADIFYCVLVEDISTSSKLEVLQRRVETLLLILLLVKSDIL